MTDEGKYRISKLIDQKYPSIAMTYLFGSQVEGDIGPQSDFDFGLLLDRDADKAGVRSGLAYERSVEVRVDFEAKIMGLYFDSLPFLRRHREDIIEENPYAARVLRYRKAFGRTQRTLDQIGAPGRKKTF